MGDFLIKIIGWIDRLKIRYIVLIALILRLFFAQYIFKVNGSDEKVFLHQWDPRWSDCYEYLNVAENIFHHGEVSSGTIERVPYIDKPLGYPVFLMISVYLNSLWAAVIIQILFSSLSVYFIFLIGQQILKNTTVAKTAALIFAFNIQSVVYSNLLLTETIYTFLLLLSVYFFLKGLSDQANLYIYLAFLFLLIGIFVRPVAYYLYPILLAIYLVNMFIKKININLMITNVLLLCTIFLVTVGIWQHRNNKLSGYKGFSAVSVDFLYSYVAPRVLANDDPVKTDSIRKTWGAFTYLDNYFSIYPEQKNLAKGEVLKIKKEKALASIKTQVPALIKLQIKGMIRTMIDRVDTSMLYFKTKDKISKFFLWIILNSLTIFNCVVLLLAIVQSFFFRGRDLSYWILIGIIVYFITMSGFHGIERYRMPVMPLYLVIVTNGIQVIWTRYNKI